MPVRTKKATRGRGKRPAAQLAAVTSILVLTGCMGNGLPGVAMFGGSSPAQPAATGANVSEITLAATDKADRGEQQSSVIDGLIARRSVLRAQSPYAQIASAVLTANKGSAAAELRVARLRAEAKSKNWLPSIGPSLSLTSLGAVAASILVEQVLLDNGKRKAERAFAAADVEIAAVGLSEEMNTRVYEGLAHYLNAQRAMAQANAAQKGVGTLQDYGRIMGLRVEGGLSDRSEERVILQKIAEMQSLATADQQAAETAMAELNAMTQVPMTGLSGLPSVNAPAGPSEPLSVLKAEGEARRALAEAKMARTGFLPGLTASGTLDKGGLSGGLSLDTDNGFGFGTGASLRAIEASEQATLQKVESARDDAARKIAALEREIATLKSREAQEAQVLAQTARNLEMFTRQYKFGRRPLMELVGMYETYTGLERAQVALKFDIALHSLQIAKKRGILVDGARM